MYGPIYSRQTYRNRKQKGSWRVRKGEVWGGGSALTAFSLSHTVLRRDRHWGTVTKPVSERKVRRP